MSTEKWQNPYNHWPDSSFCEFPRKLVCSASYYGKTT